MYYLRSQLYHIYRQDGTQQMRNVQHEVVMAAVAMGVTAAQLKIVPVSPPSTFPVVGFIQKPKP